MMKAETCLERAIRFAVTIAVSRLMTHLRDDILCF